MCSRALSFLVQGVGWEKWGDNPCARAVSPPPLQIRRSEPGFASSLDLVPSPSPACPDGKARGPCPDGKARGSCPDGKARGPCPDGKARGPCPDGKARGPGPDGKARGPGPDGNRDALAIRMDSIPHTPPNALAIRKDSIPHAPPKALAIRKDSIPHAPPNALAIRMDSIPHTPPSVEYISTSIHILLLQACVDPVPEV